MIVGLFCYYCRLVLFFVYMFCVFGLCDVCVVLVCVVLFLFVFCFVCFRCCSSLDVELSGVSDFPARSKIFCKVRDIPLGFGGEIRNPCFMYFVFRCFVVVLL